MDTAQLIASPGFLPYAAALAFVLGACIGSFITLVTYRLPREERIGATRSRCPQCSTALGAVDLVPVVSWMAGRGRCRHCRARISPRYPLTEFAAGLGAALLVWHGGVSWETVALVGLWWCIVAIIVTDLEHYIILDEVQLAAAGFGVLYGWATGAEWGAIGLAAFTGLAIGLGLKYGFLFLRQKDGLGMGDVKFLFVAGIWLAAPLDFVPYLFYSGLLGILSAVGWKLLGFGERFPFGPALALALLFCVLFPPAADAFWQLYGVLDA